MSETPTSTPETDVQREARGVPRLLPRATRRRLLFAPIITTTHAPRVWAGRLVKNADLGIGIARSYADDESWIRYGSPEEVDRDLDNLY